MQSPTTTPLRQGLATASLTIGILSIPTFGLLIVGALTGIVLGIMALKKASSDPQHYGGKGTAIGGIIASSISLFFVAVLAAIVLPSLQNALKAGREVGAVKGLRLIHEGQRQYHAAKNRYGTLKELAEEGLLDRSYASGQPVNLFVFTDSGVGPDAYCVHADRERDSAANRDFNITEDGIVYYLESKTKGTVRRGAGTPISSP